MIFRIFSYRRFLIFLILFVSVFLFVSAQPPTYHQFYGDILYENGSLVYDEMPVTARINGNISGSVVSGLDGRYGYDPLFFV